MYTKSVSEFFGRTTTFYKGRKVIGRRREGNPIHLCVNHDCPEIELTRAQGYRYWQKHFPERVCWDLPFALYCAVCQEPRSFGTYTDKNGELVGYAG